jgi:hypothetical protein
MPSPGLDIARTKADIARLDGKRAVCVGRYLAIPRPVKGMTNETGSKDRAVLELDDGARVYLEPLDSPRSVRPADERDSFDGRRVRVRGVLHVRMPSEGQSLIAPCITGIEDVVEEASKS